MISKIHSNKRLLQALKKSQSPVLDQTMNIVGERVKGRVKVFDDLKRQLAAQIDVEEETNPLEDIHLGNMDEGNFQQMLKIPLNKVESLNEIGQDNTPFNNAILSKHSSKKVIESLSLP